MATSNRTNNDKMLVSVASPSPMIAPVPETHEVRAPPRADLCAQRRRSRWPRQTRQRLRIRRPALGKWDPESRQLSRRASVGRDSTNRGRYSTARNRCPHSGRTWICALPCRQRKHMRSCGTETSAAVRVLPVACNVFSLLSGRRCGNSSCCRGEAPSALFASGASACSSCSGASIPRKP